MYLVIKCGQYIMKNYIKIIFIFYYNNYEIRKLQYENCILFLKENSKNITIFISNFYNIKLTIFTMKLKFIISVNLLNFN